MNYIIIASNVAADILAEYFQGTIVNLPGSSDLL